MLASYSGGNITLHEYDDSLSATPLPGGPHITNVNFNVNGVLNRYYNRLVLLDNLGQNCALIYRSSLDNKIRLAVIDINSGSVLKKVVLADMPEDFEKLVLNDGDVLSQLNCQRVNGYYLLSFAACVGTDAYAYTIILDEKLDIKDSTSVEINPINKDFVIFKGII